MTSLRGIHTGDLKILKDKLEQEASENLGMAMVYTLVTSAKEWLSKRFSQEDDIDNTEEDENAKVEILVPHGEPVIVDTFLACKERFEAELALERAKLIMPEKRCCSTQGKEASRQTVKGAVAITEDSHEDDEDIDFDDDDDDLEDDEEDMLEHSWLRNQTHQSILRGEPIKSLYALEFGYTLEGFTKHRPRFLAGVKSWRKAILNFRQPKGITQQHVWS